MSRFYNRTRRASSIPRKLLEEGNLHLIPLYYLLRTSELAREGMENSGSFRFADHIYGARPEGRYGIGRILDALLLRMRSAQALRARYTFAMQELRSLIQAARAAGRRLSILSVPCGLARELFELSAELGPEGMSHVRFYGLDLDDALISDLRQQCREEGLCLSFHAGDALTPADYPGTFDVILSTGLTEFLPNEDVIRFFRVVLDHLQPGGRLISSGLARHPLSDFLLRNIAEVHTHYRTEADLRALAKAAGFRIVDSYLDQTRLQTMLVATKGGELAKHQTTLPL